MHTAQSRNRVYSSSPACLLKLPDDTTDGKQTFFAVTPQNEGLRDSSQWNNIIRSLALSLPYVFLIVAPFLLSLPVCTFKAWRQNYFPTKAAILCRNSPTLYATNTHTNMRLSSLNILWCPDDADTLSKPVRGNIINCVLCCKHHHYSLIPV